jgi:outer membrane protein
MKLKTLSLAIALSGLSFAVETNAATLIQVYQDALHNDPTFKNARATWMSQEELTPIARATLLPSVDLTGAWNHNYSYTELAPGAGNKNKVSNLATYSLIASQPIFNFNGWAQLSAAKSTVKSAAATFNAAAQNLVYRTATAYFDVLTAVNDLQTTVAEKNDYLQQLKTTRERYKVGLVAITPLYEAEASYDSAVADEIAKRNAVTAKMEALREITGHTYDSLTEFANQVPLLKPDPDDIDVWVGMAMRNNYSLIAQHYLNLAAMENITVQSSAILPTLNATDTLDKQVGAGVTSGATAATSNAVGLSLNFPIFAGGGVSFVKTKQARYNYASQYATYEQTYSQLLSNTRTDFLSVATGRRQILADAKSVQSNEKQVETTEASYRVGTSTMDDVLQAYSELYKSKAQYAKDQYNFLAQTLQLKNDGGMLGASDLQAIDNSFKRTVYFHQLKNGDYLISYTNTSGDDSTPKPKPHNNTTNNYQIRHPKPVAQHSNSKYVKTNFKTVYTIQLMASKDLQKIQHFLARHRGLSLNSTTVDGEKWYTADYGNFATRQEAEHAVKNLTKFSYLNPWVTTAQIKVSEPTNNEHSKKTHKKTSRASSSNNVVTTKQKTSDTNNSDSNKSSSASNNKATDTSDAMSDDTSDNIAATATLPKPTVANDNTQQQPMNNSSAPQQDSSGSINNVLPSNENTTEQQSTANQSDNTAAPANPTQNNQQPKNSNSINNALPGNENTTKQQPATNQSDNVAAPTNPAQNNQQQKKNNLPVPTTEQQHASSMPLPRG